VLSQFTDDLDRSTLGNFIDVPNVYPAGRLDFDSEGLMLLTDNGKLQAQISHPKYKLAKTYWVQVEGEITQDHLRQLRKGVVLKDGKAIAISAQCIDAPRIPERNPPIRVRKNVPENWL
jgi:23S rRNA pseudouridine2457 synthase